MSCGARRVVCCAGMLGPFWPGQWMGHYTGQWGRASWWRRGMLSAVSGPAVDWSQLQLHFLSSMGFLSRSFLASSPWPGPVAAFHPYLIILHYWVAAIIVSQKAIGVVFKAAVRLKLGSPRIHEMSFPV